MKNTVNDEMPLVDHLQEFRRRLLACLAVVAVTSAIAYAYVDELIALLSEPAGKLYFMNPAEVFFSYLEVAVFTGVLTAFPFIFYELWAFVRPGLRAAERKLLCRLLPAGVFLFMAVSFFPIFWFCRRRYVFLWGLRRKRCSLCFPLNPIYLSSSRWYYPLVSSLSCRCCFFFWPEWGLFRRQCCGKSDGSLSFSPSFLPLSYPRRRIFLHNA